MAADFINVVLPRWTAAVAGASNGPTKFDEPEQVLQSLSPQAQTEQPPSVHSSMTVDQISSTLSPACSVPCVSVEAVHHRPWEEACVSPESLAHAIVGLSPTTIIAATPSPTATSGSFFEVSHIETLPH